MNAYRIKNDFGRVLHIEAESLEEAKLEAFRWYPTAYITSVEDLGPADEYYYIEQAEGPKLTP